MEVIPMCRTAREKDPEAVYHIMARSISEFDMFKDDEDKGRFLDILFECKEKYHCKVYEYCLMTNHYHILLDTNGFDISKFMKSLNLRYVKYVKKKYKRRGSLLAERFNSKIISDTKGLLTVSAYIHNNPKDIPEYSHRVMEYPYSSMGIYLGKKKDIRGIVNTDYILRCINETDISKALKAYIEMVTERREAGINKKLNQYLEEFEKEQYEYRQYRTTLLRNMKPDEVVAMIAEKLGIPDTRVIMCRWRRHSMKFREAVAYALTVFCGMGTKQACSYMKNISGSTLARLASRGFELFRKNAVLDGLFMA